MLLKLFARLLLPGWIVLMACVVHAADLRFNPENFKIASLLMPDGQEVQYRAYEGIPYVKNIEDEAYQKLNIYVPLNLKRRVDQDIPILMRNNVGGYMASPPGTPSAADATGRALQEGYVVCIPGARGNGSVVTRDGKEIHTGIAPNGLLDLKAAVRYLHFNDDLIPGNSQRIFSDGVSAGGAMSALLGATGDAPEYKSWLAAMGAADASDAVFASICYCPITDLAHADMEYEWLFQLVNNDIRKLTPDQLEISRELAAQCPAYLDSLELRDQNGDPVTSANYLDYLKTFLKASARKALAGGCDIPDNIGIIRFVKPGPTIAQRLGQAPADGSMAPPQGPEYTDDVTDIDLSKYLDYVASQKALKEPPAFDAWGVLGRGPTPENEVFGNMLGEPGNFTEFSLRKRTGDPTASLDPPMLKRIELLNPMPFIGKNRAAQYWYIRQGAKDRDTSFLVPINLATKLLNTGHDVDFALPWNRPHSGDYNLDDLFAWIEKVK